LNLLESDYWRCRAAEQGENGLLDKVLGKGPAVNQKSMLDVKQTFIKYQQCSAYLQQWSGWNSFL